MPHLSPFGAVALRALRAVDARARVDVRLAVLAGMILREPRGRRGLR